MVAFTLSPSSSHSRACFIDSRSRDRPYRAET
jgi:hypothetical protein